MLRSLVGSEMCIRDRDRADADLGARHVERERIGGGRGRGETETDDHRRRCLLYTSDAADDLLCVDLGGRRIIKKKKSKCT